MIIINNILDVFLLVCYHLLYQDEIVNNNKT